MAGGKCSRGNLLSLGGDCELSSAGVGINAVSLLVLGSIVRRAGKGERRSHEPFGLLFVCVNRSASCPLTTRLSGCLAW